MINMSSYQCARSSLFDYDFVLLIKVVPQTHIVGLDCLFQANVFCCHGNPRSVYLRYSNGHFLLAKAMLSISKSSCKASKSAITQHVVNLHKTFEY